MPLDTLSRAYPVSPAALARALRDVSAELYDGHACRVAAAQSRRAEHTDRQQHGTNGSSDNSSARSSREHGDGAHD